LQCLPGVTASKRYAVCVSVCMRACACTIVINPCDDIICACSPRTTSLKQLMMTPTTRGCVASTGPPERE
jgi:hypothetical protein